MRSGPRLIIERTIYSILDCGKIMMASDQLGLAGCTARHPGGGIILGFQNSGRSWCAICQLIIVFSSRLRQWIMTGVSILVELCCLNVIDEFLFHFVHKMVGARSSACPPGQIGLRKLWKMCFLPKTFPTCMETW